MAEARLRLLARKEQKIKDKALEDAAKYLASALSLDVVDRMLNAQERSRAEQAKGCITDYVAAHKKASDCPPLRWIGIR